MQGRPLLQARHELPHQRAAGPPRARGVQKSWSAVDDFETDHPHVRGEHVGVCHRYGVERDYARGIPMAQVALAWVLKNLVVTAPIVGATKPHHLRDAVSALDIRLSEDEIHTLEEAYTLRLPTGF